MRNSWITFVMFLSITAVQAQGVGELKATITKETVLTGIPSASGIEEKSNMLYVIGDDSPWLYEIDKKGEITRKFLIHDNSYEGVDRIPKDEKPDYEAIVNYKWGSKDLLIFGSGSGEKRKTMMRVDFTSRGYDVNKYTLEHLYNLIMEQGNITPEQLNIEGVVSWRDHIVLLNRETNHVILITKYAFERYMKYDVEKQKSKRINIDFYQFDLPKINGVQAQFSGGMKISGEHNMVFTASAEARESSANDGQNMGSFVGIIPLNKIGKKEMRIAQLMKDGEPYTGKVEGVYVHKVEDAKLELRLVADDDKGGSTLLKVDLER